MSSYDKLPVHRTMLSDTVRTDAFRRAIDETVGPTDCVLDFGCGVGILSLFAARAGARRVYAVDRSPLVHAARRIAADNDLDGIVFIHADGHDLELPEPVDLLVSEWLGSFVLTEGMLAPLLHLRDSWMKPGGRMVPDRVMLCAALMGDPAVHEELGYWRGRPWDVDFSFVADWPYHRVHSMRIGPEQLLGPGAVLSTLDMGTLAGVPETVEGTLMAREDGCAYGLCAWFDVRLSPGVAFSTSPDAPATHWQQTLFPLAEPLAVRAGEPVRVRFHPGTAGQTWRWAVHDGAHWRRQDDHVHAAWLQAMSAGR